MNPHVSVGLAHELIGILPDERHVAWLEGAQHQLVGVSCAGSDHLRVNKPREDAMSCRGDPADGWIVAVAGDGLGSSYRPDVGARCATELLAVNLATLAKNQRGVRPRFGGECDGGTWAEAVRRLCDGARLELETTAARIDTAGKPAFDTTLLGVVMLGDGGFFFHIGDGACLALAGSGEDTWEVKAVSPPENGEYTTSTFPVTMPDYEAHLRFTDFDGADVVLLMSDGVTPFALKQDQKSPAASFLGPVVRHVRSRTIELAANQLADYLMSPSVEAISGDDKTFIFIRRLG